jgi:cytoplasmic tRNA 2-thiolation protein 1
MAAAVNASSARTVPKVCATCQTNKPALKRPKTGEMLCRQCFFDAFENEIHETIVNNKLFRRGDKVAIAASGGKGNSFFE